MFYWLFTEGRAALSGCLAPLLCLMPLAPVIAAALMGASIRRTDRESRALAAIHLAPAGARDRLAGHPLYLPL